MQTTGIMVQTLCVPCACRCRYCLLSWDGNLPGAAYEKSRDYALRFYEWLRKNRPELTFHFSFGFSMDHPALFDALDFLNRIGSVSGQFLQYDGVAFRSDDDLKHLLTGVREHGVGTLNFTFYGTEAYHDRFAARQGDFAYMLKTARFAKEQGLLITAGVPLTKENADQADELLDKLTETGFAETRFFIPHAEGRGKALEPVRLTLEDYTSLPDRVQERLNRSVYKTEAEFFAPDALQEEKNRMLLLNLTPENLEKLERTPFSDVLTRLETLDESYYAAFPSQKQLLEMYGDPASTRFFRQRDLLSSLRGRYAAEYPVEVCDVTNERQSGSRRF